MRKPCPATDLKGNRVVWRHFIQGTPLLPDLQDNKGMLAGRDGGEGAGAGGYSEEYQGRCRNSNRGISLPEFQGNS
ncbi:MAG TPA: hypothetical protein DEO70_12980 [Bacteroidales bacterium]|nr:MAG: hypothetical protein A2X11_11340 [Bacteroidetes bacterium GWE2_42_24]OFY28895.1 MAG: hypothetical protein A2X09_12825 [Bacteroidetes bacterium GWF2_43_11]HBZ67742.1 hypothetical protein [Bacteroidales bacterium]